MVVICKLCNLKFNNQDKYKIHFDKTHYEKYNIYKYECGCDEGFEYCDGIFLKKHMKKTHFIDINLFSCTS